MKTHHTRYVWLSVVSTVVIFLLAACQPVLLPPPQAVNAEEEFSKAIFGLEEAYQKEDTAAVMAYYAENSVSHAPGFPSDVGKQAVTVAYQAFFDIYELERDFQLIDMKISGNFATRTADWTQILTPKDGSEPITEIGRCILGWEKIDGEWLVVWEIWNTYPGLAVQ